MIPETISSILNTNIVNKKISVNGWVKTCRSSKSVSFISINDGSTIQNLQIVAESINFDSDFLKKITTGASLLVSGELVQSKGGGQKCEVLANSITILGEALSKDYPLQPKKHSLEFLRNISHLRFRTSTFSAVFRVRHALMFAIHNFFNDLNFVNIHSPIITGADAEGAGEMFTVTNLNFNNLPKKKNGAIDFSKDFFEKKTNLTVSGQLEAELAALGLGKVYTFGPTFRAENSNTSRHLAEFWMVEPEMAFTDLKENMILAEDLLKYCVSYCLTHCESDLNFLNNRLLEEEKTIKKEFRLKLDLLNRLDFVMKNSFYKISYTEAIKILQHSTPNKKKKFNYLINGFGADLQSEHERFLVEKEFNCPVIIYDYPKDIKPFYMRLNSDKKTVAAMDVLFPVVGEIVGGSQREERYKNLYSRMIELGVSTEELWWYLETRKFGTCVHSGFGLGFERLVMFVTGMKNIRDVIPFPRTPKNAAF